MHRDVQRDAAFRSDTSGRAMQGALAEEIADICGLIMVNTEQQ